MKHAAANHTSIEEALPVRPPLPVLPGTLQETGQLVTLGVLGGGQLGRMFVHAAQRLGYRTAVLDPDPNSPAGMVSHHHVQTPYEQPSAWADLAAHCAAITTEFENVPAAALEHLGRQRIVAPHAASVAMAQDRVAEKACLAACAASSGVTVAPYAVIATTAQLEAVDGTLLLPGILKTARMGYDGKGQARVRTPLELAQAWSSFKQAPCVLEKLLPLKAEYSVLVARGFDGTMVGFAPQRNVHVHGILAATHAYPGNMHEALLEKAQLATQSIANQIGYVGVLCIEFFVATAADGQDVLLINEVAPRPHNSGHYTLDACDVSQFDLQVLTLAGLPLPSPRQHSSAVMLNLLGDLWWDAQQQPRLPDWQAILALPGAKLHLYGKESARIGRKMGHLTLLGGTPAQALASARQAALILGIQGLEPTL